MMEYFHRAMFGHSQSNDGLQPFWLTEKDGVGAKFSNAAIVTAQAQKVFDAAWSNIPTE